jgi:hypothetical protein
MWRRRDPPDVPAGKRPDVPGRVVKSPIDALRDHVG